MDNLLLQFFLEHPINHLKNQVQIADIINYWNMTNTWLLSSQCSFITLVQKHIESKVHCSCPWCARVFVIEALFCKCFCNKLSGKVLEIFNTREYPFLELLAWKGYGHCAWTTSLKIICFDLWTFSSLYLYNKEKRSRILISGI